MKYILILCVVLVASSVAGAAQFDLPAGNPLTLHGVFAIIIVLYEFLIDLAGVLMAATIIVSGILWLSAGENPSKVERAKAVFKGGIIGSLIILGSGVIIRTVEAIISQRFF